MKENNDNNLNNEIWIQNKIEEARQETENLIYEQIKSLDYNKTIKDINETMKKLSKQIETVDYNKSRELEGLEEDFNIKLDDVKTLDEDSIRDTIISITDDTISKNKISLEKTLKKEINKAFSQIDIVKETDELKQKFEEYKNIVDIDTIKQQQENTKQNIEKLEETYNDEIKISIAELNKKLEELITVSIEELKNKQLESEKQADELKKIYSNYEAQINSIEENKKEVFEFVDKTDKSMKELLESQNSLEKDFVIYQKDIDKDFVTYKQDLDNKINSIEEFNKNIIKEQTTINESIPKLTQDQLEMKNNFADTSKAITADLEKCEEELFKLRENFANQILTLEKKLNEKIDFEIKKVEQEIIKKINVDDINENIDLIFQKIALIDKENKRKLAELENRQEYLINQNSNNVELDDIKQNINEITKKLENIKNENQYLQKQNIAYIKDYIEKRILKMKYVTTIQSLVQEINNLNKKIELLQTSNTGNDNDDDERIIELIDKQVKQTINQMIKEERTKNNKAHAVSNINKKVEKKSNEKLQLPIIVNREFGNELITQNNIFLEEDLRESTVDKIVNTTRAISNMAKVIRKSQILSSPEQQD